MTVQVEVVIDLEEGEHAFPLVRPAFATALNSIIRTSGTVFGAEGSAVLDGVPVRYRAAVRNEYPGSDIQPNGRTLFKETQHG